MCPFNKHKTRLWTKREVQLTKCIARIFARTRDKTIGLKAINNNTEFVLLLVIKMIKV